MLKQAVIYGFFLAIAAAVLTWLEYRYFLQLFSTEAYITLVALLFTGLGVWAGTRLHARGQDQSSFKQNAKAISTLKISARELEVLEQLAGGASNKEIATKLSLSPNTIKTHIAHLYEKLDVSRRTQAIDKARSLNILP